MEAVQKRIKSKRIATVETGAGARSPAATVLSAGKKLVAQKLEEYVAEREVHRTID
jgi:hypothetical protein